MGTGPWQNKIPQDLKGGPARGPKFFLPRRQRKRAFSLVELLLCIAMWSVLAGILLLSLDVGILTVKSEEAVVKPSVALRESKNIYRWLQKVMIKACIERRSFQVKYYSGYRDFIRIQWFDPLETETYRTEGRCWVAFESSKNLFYSYAPAWHTMTPAFTLKISNGQKNGQVVSRISVSPYCLVTLKEE
ncbi:hypothetical protein Tlie_0523 [Thermovirga lienii DSM 17291]|uniref:Prepilin-type N-terminal cleavage/methylation domain-containing protein n=1 Tax=Thermovirga lienii (strain ATCC BAA-1197 / DSM 17291 / Cas60314) TaxID=580340 RepID=G7V822_THELD|nr:hypothetical protein Tlie_0523 [Thermovirga lienii DSM 17291]